MKLSTDVTSSRRSKQSAGMQRMTRRIFTQWSRPTVQFTGIRSAILYTELGKGVAPSTPESSVDSVLLTIAGFLS